MKDDSPKPEKVAKKEADPESKAKESEPKQVEKVVAPTPSIDLNSDGTIGTLYHFNDHYRTHLIRIVANYAGHKIKVITDPNEFKSQKFLEAFPLGKLPAFLLPDGECRPQELDIWK